MDDLINRKDIVDKVCEGISCNECSFNEIDGESGCLLAYRIDQLPSAQPEIIRCGQCKYAEVADKEDVQDGYTCQFHRGSIWFSGSYCSWAERRTDE